MPDEGHVRVTKNPRAARRSVLLAMAIFGLSSIIFTLPGLLPDRTVGDVDVSAYRTRFDETSPAAIEIGDSLQTVFGSASSRRHLDRQARVDGCTDDCVSPYRTSRVGLETGTLPATIRDAPTSLRVGAYPPVAGHLLVAATVLREQQL